MVEPVQSEWWVQEGIGEDRAVLYRNNTAIAAKIDWPGELGIGAVVEGVFSRKSPFEGRGTGSLADGSQVLIEGLPRSASEGSAMRFLVKRAAVRESGRSKLPVVVPTDQPCRETPRLRERLGGRLVSGFGRDVWEELRGAAWEGEMHFPGMRLKLSPTPAMTLIDVDGDLPPRQLALAAARGVHSAIRELDLSGSIGIDFPTLSVRADRKAVDQALDEALGDWKHERTAMNGFGFVQIVSRVEAPSLLHRQQLDREGAAARWLLYLAEAHAAGAGEMLIRAHPRVVGALRDEWLGELRRRTGRTLRIERDAALALDAPNIQISGHG